jgi:hypothetical protein
MKNNAEGSSNGSAGLVSARGVAFPPDVAEQVRRTTMHDLSPSQIRQVNEYLGDIFISRRRMQVKLAVGAVLLYEYEVGEPFSSATIANKCLRYINKNISVSSNSVSGFLKVMFSKGLLSYEQHHSGRVWWRNQ